MPLDIVMDKPPLGVIPKYYFERARIQELSRAIHEYAGDCRQGDNLIVWVDELKERIIEWNRLERRIDGYKKNA